MSTAGVPVRGPDIPGLTFVRLLGRGGYGDVFLYEESVLSRPVAVKILRSHDLSSDLAASFHAEARAMASLQHPNIVGVFGTGTTTDGRPYLTMQYCEPDTMEDRAVGGRLPVAEVLRTGISIGGAVETAHRFGMLHRDIKPANILIMPWGAPGLTDFGVAAEMAGGDDEDAGVSIPWSPPEMIYSSTRGSAASDVYSLAATLWHLLVGRSPFEIPGGDNSRLALMSRVRDWPAPSTARPDTPEALDRLLRHALSKSPAQRPQSMADFVRSLQLIEEQQRLPRTVADMRGPVGGRPTPSPYAAPAPPVAPPPGIGAGRGTVADRGGGVGDIPADTANAGTVIRARTAGTAAPVPPGADRPGVGGGPGVPRTDDAVAEERTERRPRPMPSAPMSTPSPSPSRGGPPSAPRGGTTETEAATELRPRVSAAPIERGPDPKAKGGTKALLIGGVVALVLVAVGLTYVLIGRGTDPKATPKGTATSSDGVDGPGGVTQLPPPGVATVTAVRKGAKVTFTWTYADSVTTDKYRYRVGGKNPVAIADNPTVTLTAPSAATLCVEVQVVRADGSNPQTTWSKPGCS